MKKTIFATLISICAVILVFDLFYIFQTLRSPVFDMVIPLPDFPENVQIYKMVSADITVEYVKAIGAKFGLTGAVSGGSENYLLSNQETKESLMVYKATGGIRYYRSIQDPGGGPRIPSHEKAATIAIDTLKEKDLIPDGAITTSVKRGGSFGLWVEITYPIDGHPFGGNNYVVGIGDMGVVVYVGVNPVKYEPYKMAKMKPVKLAYEEIKETGRKYASGNSKWVSINNVSLIYWPRSMDPEDDYVYPIYLFEGDQYTWVPIFSALQNQYLGPINATQESTIEFPGVSDYLTNSLILNVGYQKKYSLPKKSLPGLTLPHSPFNLVKISN